MMKNGSITVIKLDIYDFFVVVVQNQINQSITAKQQQQQQAKRQQQLQKEKKTLLVFPSKINQSFVLNRPTIVVIIM